MKSFKNILGYQIILASMWGLASSCSSPAAKNGGSDADLLAIDVSNRRPLEQVVSSETARSFAQSNQYAHFNANDLEEGMVVSFSVDYGAGGGEVGTASGVLVKHKNKFYFKPVENHSTQLLLAPGQRFNHSETNGPGSLWNFSDYLDLVNRVVYGDSSLRSPENNNAPVYTKVSAAVADVSGGTDGKKVAYQDALELNLKRSNPNKSETRVVVYASKGAGPRVLDFRETGDVGGSFKVYIGAKK